MYCRPQNHKELFNLHHAQLRNVIEQIFGVVKWRSKVLVVAQEYSIQTQAQLVGALAVLHNFIQIHDLTDVIDGDEDPGEDAIPPCCPRHWHNPGQQERQRADNCQEQITLDMWNDYVHRRHHN
jgi:hypothetical protein